MSDRGPEFDGVRVRRPDSGALIDTGYRSIDDLPDDLTELLALRGVGPSAITRLTEVEQGQGPEPSQCASAIRTEEPTSDPWACG